MLVARPVPRVVLALIILAGLARGETPANLALACLLAGEGGWAERGVARAVRTFLAAGDVWYFPSFLVDLGEAVLFPRKDTTVVEKLLPLLVELR